MSRYRWVILAVGVLAQGSFAAVVQGLPAIAPGLRSAYGLDLGELGLVLSCTTAGLVLSILAWGALADRIGERPVMTSGLVIAAAALGAAAASNTPMGLMAMLVLAGIGGGSVNAASGKAVAGWFADHQRGFALSVRQTALPVGAAVGAAVLPPIAGISVRAALAALGAGCLVSAIVVALWMREPPPEPDPRPRGPRPIRHGGVWRMSAVTALLLVPQFSFVAFLVLYLHDERGISAQVAAAILAGVHLSGAAGRILAGIRSDRTRRRIRPVRALSAAMSVLFLVSAALLPRGTGLVLPVLLAAGITAICWNGLVFAATAELVGQADRGRALGMINSAGAASAAVSPALFAAMVAASSWRTAYAMLAVFPAIAIVVLGPLAGAEHARRT